jgi:hypothetical protein
MVVRSGPTGALGGTDGLTVIDLGRFAPGDEVSESWLACSDVAVVVVRGDASGAVHLRDRGDRIADACGGRIGVVAVGAGYTCQEIAGFAGVMPVADIPLDTPAAEVACGAAGSGRRLDRSLLWVSATRMAMTLAGQVEDGREATDPLHPSGTSEPDDEPTGPGDGHGPVDPGPGDGPVGRLRSRAGRPAVRGVRTWRGSAARTAADGAGVVA